ncbi:ROK family protein [soil metagenome]
MLVAGVDVGGTNIGAGLVDDDHSVVGRGKCPTPQSRPEEVAEAIIELVEGLEEQPAAVGVGLPGVIHEGRVLTAPNLAGWDDSFDVVSPLEERLSAPVALANDANVGVIGEWLAGAAAGHDDVLGVWMGTGIGGGLILGGRPHRGARGGAGEIGHVITQHAGALCTCGRRGCIEAYAGRRSMAATAHAMVDAGRHTSLFDIQEAEGKPRPTSKVWAKALEDEDELATRLFDLAIEVVGVGIGSMINMLDVDLVVIGGGMAEKLGQDLADRIADQARPVILHPNPDLEFVAAALGDDSGLVGAAEVGRAHLLSP